MYSGLADESPLVGNFALLSLTYLRCAAVLDQGAKNVKNLDI